MEITSFVLGMLAIVTVAMVAVIVVGIVKILKLSKHVKDLETTFFQTRGDLYRNIEERIQPVWRQFEETGRDITMVEKTIMNQIDQARQETGKATHTVRTDLSGYIDSRIDKLIDTYFEHIGAKKSKKEFING
jgi:predicted Holliday junction resolvase-like endonuclease